MAKQTPQTQTPSPVAVIDVPIVGAIADVLTPPTTPIVECGCGAECEGDVAKAVLVGLTPSAMLALRDACRTLDVPQSYYVACLIHRDLGIAAPVQAKRGAKGKYDGMSKAEIAAARKAERVAKEATAARNAQALDAARARAKAMQAEIAAGKPVDMADLLAQLNAALA